MLRARSTLPGNRVIIKSGRLVSPYLIGVEELVAFIPCFTDGRHRLSESSGYTIVESITKENGNRWIVALYSGAHLSAQALLSDQLRPLTPLLRSAQRAKSSKV